MEPFSAPPSPIFSSWYLSPHPDLPRPQTPLQKRIIRSQSVRLQTLTPRIKRGTQSQEPRKQKCSERPPGPKHPKRDQTLTAKEEEEQEKEAAAGDRGRMMR